MEFGAIDGRVLDAWDFLKMMGKYTGCLKQMVGMKEWNRKWTGLYKYTDR